MHGLRVGRAKQALAALWGTARSRDAPSLPTAGGELAGAARLVGLCAQCQLLCCSCQQACRQVWDEDTANPSRAVCFTPVVPHVCI